PQRALVGPVALRITHRPSLSAASAPPFSPLSLDLLSRDAATRPPTRRYGTASPAARGASRNLLSLDAATRRLTRRYGPATPGAGRRGVDGADAVAEDR